MSNLLQYRFFTSIQELQEFVNGHIIVDQVITVVFIPGITYTGYQLIYWTPDPTTYAPTDQDGLK